MYADELRLLCGDYHYVYNNAGNQLVSVGGEGPAGGAVEGAKTRVVRWDWQAGTIEAQSAGCV